MMRALLTVLLLGGLGACAGEQGPAESGSACWDGKDNDRDERIDCADPDCAALAICSSNSDGGRRDRGAADGGGSDAPRPADGRAPDRARDLAPPPDQAPSSSYGTACDFARNPLGRCADGETVCIPRPDQQAGFCSYPCPGPPDSCPPAAAGQYAACIYGVNGKPYCLFVCKLGGSRYDCPPGFDCVAEQYTQSHCYPRP